MNSFYSLVKISPNSFTQDSIIIGLIVFDGNSFHFQFSDLKKRIAKSLMKTDSKQIELLVKEIAANLQKVNNQSQKQEHTFFNINQPISEDYFEYLSKYSNGILGFTAPKAIYDRINTVKFNQLFHLLVDQIELIQKEKSSEKEIQFYKTVTTKLINRVANRVHTNIELDSKFAPTLLSAFKIDCIGKNGSLIGAKTLPLTKTTATLHKELNTYISVIAHLKTLKAVKHENNQFFLISDEPSSKTSEEFRIYKQLKDAESIFKLISSDESESVAEKIENQNAQMFLTV